jgi:energy-converting hydrogenase A subunit M
LFRFGDGYTILIRTNIDVNRQNVIDYIQKYIPEAIVKEEHNKMIHFRVSTNVSLYKMFSILEQAREELTNLIEDYTVSQVTLDDVFVNFAKMQEENQLLEQQMKEESIYEVVYGQTNRIGKFIECNTLLVMNYFLLIQNQCECCNRLTLIQTIS